jgi:dipeptidyl aminopeptidase/acylaminoacyl peptidase
MTTPRRFESDLPALLADLYLTGTPDYRDDVVQRIERTRQRPAWTFPERWLPVELVSQRVPTTRMPWRQLGVLALIAILLMTFLALYIGTHVTRVPPPFGVADNGLVAYAKGGDILTVDPKTGTATAIITGPEVDARPSFSRDGTKGLFLRRVDGSMDQFRLMAARSDGSNVHVVREASLTASDVVEWSADGNSILVAADNSVVIRYDESGATSTPILEPGARFLAGEIRPPDGAQILYESPTPVIDLWIMDADGSNARLVYTPPMQAQNDIDQVKWSPDGRLIGFKCQQPGDVNNDRICVMNPDGSQVRIADVHTTGDWTETDFVWSPDSRYIAFNRWHKDPLSFAWQVQPIGLVTVADGTLVDLGPTPAPEGALFDFSPDGKTILSLPDRLFRSTDPAMAAAKPLAIDVATGVATEVSWEVTSDISWQRVAH